MPSDEALGPGLRVLQRGRLSSNNILLDHEEGVVLVDCGHCVHAAQTVALLRELLGTRALHELINTHLHSEANAAFHRPWPAAGGPEAAHRWAPLAGAGRAGA